MTEENTTMKDILEKIEKGISNLSEEEKRKKEKKFKLPLGRKVSKSQAKKNYVTIMKINENGNVDFSKKQIDEQAIMEDGVPRLCGSQYVMYYKRNPLIILPSWSVVPFSPAERYEKSLNDGSNKKGYKILMDKMQNEQTGTKKQISGIVKWIFGLGILGIIGYAFISGA